MTLDELVQFQKNMAAAEEARGEKMFMHLPDRWFDDMTWRCLNGHVSKSYVKSEAYGDLCPKCQTSVKLTFPEDREVGCTVHHFEYYDDEYGSLADGGSYEIYQCVHCGKKEYSPLPD